MRDDYRVILTARFTIDLGASSIRDAQTTATWIARLVFNDHFSRADGLALEVIDIRKLTGDKNG